MALLEKCFCCSLVVAASVIGVYTLIAYVIAFTMEIWWIVQTRANLPSFAYFLCTVYFLTFVISGFLLRGLSVRNTLYLLEWLIIISVFSFPEAGLVFFMCIYYRKVHSLYGLTELTCWACRVVVNIAGVICIQSLYSTWKEEKHVVRSLQGLHMKSLERPRRVSVMKSNGHGDNNSGAAYQNVEFSVGLPSDRIRSSKQLPPNSRLKRSASSASQSSVISPISSQQHSGSLPYGINDVHLYQQQTMPRPASPFPIKPALVQQDFRSPSEFNASVLDLYLFAAMRNAAPQNTPVPLYRTQSMLNLSGGIGTTDTNLVARKAMSVVDYPAVSKAAPLVKSTHSLDRRVMNQNRSPHVRYFAAGNGRLRNAYFPQDFRKVDFKTIAVPFPTNAGMEFTHPVCTLYPYGNNTINYFKPRSLSKTSIGNESDFDDFRKYRDVAL